MFFCTSSVLPDYAWFMDFYATRTCLPIFVNVCQCCSKLQALKNSWNGLPIQPHTTWDGIWLNFGIIRVNAAIVCIKLIQIKYMRITEECLMLSLKCLHFWWCHTFRPQSCVTSLSLLLVNPPPSTAERHVAPCWKEGRPKGKLLQLQAA